MLSQFLNKLLSLLCIFLRNNAWLSKIEIDDAEIINAVKQAWDESAVPTNTYPSRESSDIVFHTNSGDIYGKIKYPISSEEDECTIIMEGYFWYECEELYRVLYDIKVDG